MLLILVEIMNTLSLTALSVYNTVTDICSKGSEGLMRFLHSLSCYLSGTSNQWYFMLNNIGPVPASYYSNTTYSLPNTVEWIFDSYELTSTLHPSIQRQYAIQYGTLPFLSANITVHNRTFSLDEFIQNFKIEFTPNNIPEPLHILRFWSITRSLWFTVTENPILNVIDNEGNEHSFSVFGDYDMDQWNSFFVVYDEELEEEEDEQGEAEQPIPEVVPEQPVLEQSVPEQPTPEVVSEQPIPEVVPEQPVFEQSVPEQPTPDVVSEQPTPEVVPEQPVLQQPVPDVVPEQPIPDAVPEVVPEAVEPSLITHLELIEPTE